MKTPNQNIQQKQAIEYAVKSVGAKVKDVDLTKRIVTGFYNSFYFFDSDNDVLLPGCTAKSISDRGPSSNATGKIKHLLHHDWSMLPGKPQLIEEKTIGGITGVYFETKMSSTQMGTDTLINYQEEVYDNHSIGFRYLSGKYVERGSADWDKYIRMLINPQDAEKSDEMYVWDEIMMYEGSTVAFGANSLTPYLGVKSMSKEALLMKINDRISKLSKQLKSGTQSDEMLQSFEMEMLQLKQLIQEIFTATPSIKDTLKEQGRPENDASKSENNPATGVKSVDFSKFLLTNQN